MFKLIKYLKPYAFSLVALTALVYVQVMANLSLPDYMARIVNEGIVGKDNGLVLRNGGTMLLVTLLGAVCTVGVGFLAARIATGFAKDLRERVFTKVEHFSLAEFDSFSTASLITRTTNDIQQIQMVTVMLLRLALMAPLTGIGAITKAYHTAPSMTWIMALAVAVLLAIVGTIFGIAIPRFQLLQKLTDRLNLVTREILTGLRVIRAFNAEAYEEKKFEVTNAELTATNLFVNRVMAFMQPAMTLIMSFTSIGIVWVGAHLIDAGSLQIGDMIAFMQYAMQVIFAFLMISIIFIMVPRASVSGQRVSEVLAVDPEIADPASPKKADGKGSGLVSFENVSFAYPGAEEPVLKHVSFTARPGQTTAIIGSTGSGKSTLVNLIPRFYDATEGAVTVDGVDVRDMRLEDVYAKIGYVPQRAVLFSGSVNDNLAYGAPNAPEEEVRHAARIAQALPFVEALEEGFASAVSQGGTNFSGGQKQRLSIARAIARKPEIYIFDDSFSALDFKTDNAVRAALAAETKDKTVIIVAQRISTIVHADQIVVLDNGTVVAIGRHEDLLKTSPVYREIAESQLSEEELTAVGKEAA